MRKLISLVMFFGFMCFSIGAWAQTQTVTGNVSDSNGDAVIGATVRVPGTQIGTITDFNGDFRIDVPDGTEAVMVSYVGMAPQTIALDGGALSVSMQQDSQILDDVVVTTLGVDRNARNIAFANQRVSGDDLLSTPSKNALEALRGKTAGVKISTGSGSVAASTRIVLRGESSLTGNNNALIIVDGIPIDNSSIRGDTRISTFTSGEAGYTDYGNRLNDLDPNSIESVQVLKGGSATSIYGSRGAAGVVLITTKTGQGKFKVGVTTSSQLDEAYVLFKRQSRYGQGFDGAHFDSGENWSWGPEFDGVVRPWTSPVDTDGDGALEALTRPYSAVPDQLDDLFNTGYSFNNSVNVSGGNEIFSYYGSYGNVNQEGTLDNSDYGRNAFNFKGSAKLSDKVKTDFGINYSRINTNTHSEGARAFEGQNSYANAIQSPVNIPFNELRDYNNPFHDLNGYYGSYSVNPFFVLNEYINNGKIQNLLGRGSITYSPLENLSFTGIGGINTTNRQVEQVIPQHTYATHLIWGDGLALSSRGGRNNNPGDYYREERERKDLDVNIYGNYEKSLDNLVSGLNMDATLGYHFYDLETKGIFGETVGGIVVPGWYHFDNSVQPSKADEVSTRRRLIGTYGNLRLGLQDKYFIDYSARRDVSSTLPEDNNNFFYQGVGAAAVVKDYDQGGTALSFAKLRGSYGTTGKDAAPYLINSTYQGNPNLQTLGNGHDLTFPLNGQAGFTNSGLIGNASLKPELTKTFEIGADLGFWDDRINLTYTYYKSEHNDQIVVVSLPNSSGFTQTASNIGAMENKGHEVTLNLQPLDNIVPNLLWDVNLSWAKNENEVIKVTDDIDELTIQTHTRSVSIVAKEGLPFGTFKGTVKQYDANGRVIVGNDGFPLLDAAQQYIGNYQPDWTGSAGTSVGFKNFSINALLDIRKGGQFVSYTKFGGDFNGTSMATLNSDGSRAPFIIPNSVDEMGNPNTIEVTQQDYHTNYTAASEELLVDADFVKLREVGLSYSFPKKFLNNIASNMMLTAYGTNLKYWLADNNTFADSEINGPGLTGNSSGVETSQVPSSRSIGIRLKATF